MGSYNETIVGTGKNRDEALLEAQREYLYENGHRCSFRDLIRAKLLERVPPTVTRTVEESYRDMFGRTKAYSVTKSVPDTDAPKSKWLEKWEFEIWVHS